MIQSKYLSTLGSKAWLVVHSQNRRRLHVSPNQHYWYQTVGYVLGALVDGAGYDQHAQLRALDGFVNLVAEHLGPAPSLALGFHPRWESFMTDDHNPVELSWDFHTGADKPTIRYSIEPISPDAGTPSNPHNDRAPANFKRAVVGAFPDTETAWYDHFDACFSHGWTDELPEGHPSTVFWAFDLAGKADTPKAYFFPGAVACATGRTNLEIISDAIRSAPGYSPEKLAAFHDFEEYVGARSHLSLEMDMLAIDLVPVAKSRLKIYFRNRATDFASVRELMSLGGRLAGPDLDEGLRRLRILWDSLLGTEGVPDDVSLPHRDHRTAGILYNIEFRLDSRTPKVKVYIPVRHYAESDGQVIDSLRRFMTDEVATQRGFEEAEVNAQMYSQCMRSTL